MPTWLVILLIIAAIIAFGIFTNPDKETKRRLGELLANRPERDEVQYQTDFFADADIPKHVVTTIRNLFSEQIGVDLSLLEPDDDLSKDYSLIWDLDSMADVEIILALEEEFDIEISDGEAASMRSIRSIASVVTSKLHEKQQG